MIPVLRSLRVPARRGVRFDHHQPAGMQKKVRQSIYVWYNGKVVEVGVYHVARPVVIF